MIRTDYPRRYLVNDDGDRVLLGLTPEETDEFEILDGSSPSSQRAGETGGDAVTHVQERWLALYARHDDAWRTWLRQAGNLTRSGPFPGLLLGR